MTEVKIKSQDRQSLAMKVTPNGVEVLIPHQLDPDSEQVQTFIDEGLQKLPPPSPPTETLTKAEIVALVDRLAGELEVTVIRVQLRRMRQKWGSISTAGTLTLADDLLNLPRHLVEYVICHELLHLKVPHHNRLYYLLLAQHIPDWEQREQELGQWILTESTLVAR
jgi:predicted metal-dependent hydrolase